jgi:hypothetical protein
VACQTHEAIAFQQTTLFPSYGLTYYTVPTFPRLAPHRASGANLLPVGIQVRLLDLSKELDRGHMVFGI